MLFTDLSSDRLVRALQKAGYRIITQGKHIGMSNGNRRLTIPRHNRLNPLTVKGILRDAGMTPERLRELL